MKVKKSSYNNREIAIQKKRRRFVMILKFFLLGNPLSLCIKIRKNINMDTWTNMHIGTKINKNTKAGTYNDHYQKIYNKDIYPLTIHQKTKTSNKRKTLFDWMGMNNNIKVYCLLLRLINLKEIAISSIQRGEMSLDVMLIQYGIVFVIYNRLTILILLNLIY